MTYKIDFAVWSPTEEVFWNSWIARNICTAPYQWTPDYPGIQISDQIQQGWTPMREDGSPVPGWHANVRITGPLVAEFTHMLEQYGEDGDLLPLWDRTWAAEVFGLTDQPADPETGFPAGMRNTAGVTYADPMDIHTPTNVIL